MAASQQNKQNKAQALPKFGDWDVNNPASADGFTVIFAKKAKDNAGNVVSPRRKDDNNNNNANKQETYQSPPKWKWFCCL